MLTVNSLSRVCEQVRAPAADHAGTAVCTLGEDRAPLLRTHDRQHAHGKAVVWHVQELKSLPPTSSCPQSAVTWRSSDVKPRGELSRVASTLRSSRKMNEWMKFTRWIKENEVLISSAFLHLYINFLLNTYLKVWQLFKLPFLYILICLSKQLRKRCRGLEKWERKRGREDKGREREKERLPSCLENFSQTVWQR